jgi:hypothetical protein
VVVTRQLPESNEARSGDFEFGGVMINLLIVDGGIEGSVL